MYQIVNTIALKIHSTTPSSWPVLGEYGISEYAELLESHWYSKAHASTR